MDYFKVFLWVFRDPAAKFRHIFVNRPQQFPSISLPVHYSLITLPFDATFSELPTVQLNKLINCVGFEVFTSVVMKSIIFWDMTPCSPLSLTDVSEEHIASIFTVEEIGSAKAASKQVAIHYLK
jgi:hypothetical protein